MANYNIPMYSITVCYGWEIKSPHTIFSYVFSFMSNDRIFGNIIAHWYFKISSEIYGGVPSTLYDILTES